MALKPSDINFLSSMVRPSTFSLSVHADYACRHSGACCAAPWDVPVETAAHLRLSEAVSLGRLGPGDPFLTVPEGQTAVIRRTPAGTCVFFDETSRLCEVHRTLGDAAMPWSCRLFPRIALSDPRGTFITLSHFCPTAAAMLFREDVSLGVVEGPPAFPATQAYGGLDATDEWPPLLRPRMLMDLESYGAWEQHVVARCADEHMAPFDVVATLRRDVELLRRWQPGGESLVDAIRMLPRTCLSRNRPDLHQCRAFRALVVSTVPDALRGFSVTDLDGAHGLTRAELSDHGLISAVTRWIEPEWPLFRRPANRFVAAHAFGSWMAYQGLGLRSFVRSLETALAVLVVESATECAIARRPLDKSLLVRAVRRSDLLLNHLAARETLSRIWSRVEEGA